MTSKQYLIRACTIITLCSVWGMVEYSSHAKPHASVKAPTTRYHGYTLNQKAIKRAKLFTVLISVEGFGGVSRGTGVLLDSTHVLTCAHVAQHENGELWVYFYPGYILAHAKPVRMDTTHDLAILEIDVPVQSPVWPVFQEKHYDGEPITIIGNILGSMKWFVGYGIISGEGEDGLYTDGLVKGGDSGGPWINEAGEVLALSDWTIGTGETATGIGGGIPAKTINKFLDGWKQPPFGLEQLLGLIQ